MRMLQNDTGIPLYIQLKDILKEKILCKKYRANDKIPPENELCDQYGVSRITVRKAIEKLVQEKLLYRLQGKGTFVMSGKLRRTLPKLYSFSEDMRELGFVPASRTLEQQIIEADDTIQTLLRLPEDSTQVNKFVRLRMANNEPILIETVYIPIYLCPDLIQKDLEKDSLYRILKDDYQYVLEYAEEHYDVTILGIGDAALLQIREGAPAFSIERITYLANEVPIELTRAIGRGDRLRFTVKLIKNSDTEFTKNIVRGEGTSCTTFVKEKTNVT